MLTNLVVVVVTLQFQIDSKLVAHLGLGMSPYQAEIGGHFLDVDVMLFFPICHNGVKN